MDNLIQAEDSKYYIAKPDPNFSPARNKAIIEETIKDTEKFFNSMAVKVIDEINNRADILATYGVYRFNRGEKTFKDYVGKQMFQNLIGEKILDRVRLLEESNKLTGRKDRLVQL